MQSVFIDCSDFKIVLCKRLKIHKEKVLLSRELQNNTSFLRVGCHLGYLFWARPFPRMDWNENGTERNGMNQFWSLFPGTEHLLQVQKVIQLVSQLGARLPQVARGGDCWHENQSLWRPADAQTKCRYIYGSNSLLFRKQWLVAYCLQGQFQDLMQGGAKAGHDLVLCLLNQQGTTPKSIWTCSVPIFISTIISAIMKLCKFLGENSEAR